MAALQDGCVYMAKRKAFLMRGMHCDVQHTYKEKKKKEIINDKAEKEKKEEEEEKEDELVC